MNGLVVAATFIGAVTGAILSGCSGPQPFVREGNAASVEIGYAGDVASALPVARRHCAGFERVPRLVSAGIDIALFDCVRP
jgi:hypothetical protein